MAIQPEAAGRREPTVQIPCLDTFHRKRAVTVWAHPGHGASGHVILVAPAGEAARLGPQEARALAGQLVTHADRLEAGDRWLQRRARAQMVPLRGQREG